MINFNWYLFNALTGKQVYEILSLRASVFVVDQKCIYLDPDEKDYVALHLLGTHENKLVAYLRLFIPDNRLKHLIFGRVVTSASERAKGYGKKLIKEMLSYCDKHYPHHHIKCSAQNYLRGFYENFGFETVGSAYEEAGILHIAMEKIAKLGK